MSPLLLVAGAALWIGTVLLLSELRWFARTPLAERLRPYVPGGMGQRPQRGILSVESFQEAIGPVARALGERVAGVLGVQEDVGARLARVHSPLTVTQFRTQQLGTAVGAFGLGGLAVIAARPDPPLIVLVLVVTPALGFLVQEQRLAWASSKWKENLRLEMPVVAEQLAMLLSSGYSLSGALNRIAQRGKGASSRDLARVCRRVRQGLSEVDALREWAEVADNEALDRLVPVLALNREASDLGRLLSEESRQIRQELQRELTELAEKRTQQVWIPVTVATLLPGVMLIAVPFVQALQDFGM